MASLTSGSKLLAFIFGYIFLIITAYIFAVNKIVLLFIFDQKTEIILLALR